MKKIPYIIALLLFVITQSFAQSIDQKADSLQLLIQNAKEDTIKAKHYIELGALYVYSEPNKALNILHEARALSEKIQFEKTLGESYKFLFNVHDVLASHSDSLLFYIKKIEELYKETGNVAYAVRKHWNLAIYYRNFGQSEKIIEEYLKALELVREHNFPKTEEARLLGNIGTVLDTNGEHLEALKYYEQAAALFDDDKIGQAITYFNMAIIYSRQQNKIDTALNLFNKTYTIVDEAEFHSLMAGVLLEQGYCYEVMEQYEQANQLYKQALQISKDHNLGENFINIYSTYAEHYYKREQYQLALQYSNKAIKLSEEKEDNRLLKSLYELQDKCYTKIGDYKKAYSVKSQLMVHLDSINNTERQGKFKELKTKYEVEQKELENELLKAEKEIDQRVIRNQTIIAIGLLLALLFATIWGIATYRANQREKQSKAQIKELVEELKVKNQELKRSNTDLESFASVASHDMQEPLRTIGNFVELLKEENEEQFDEESHQYMNFITDGVSRMSALIDALLTYSQVGKQKMEMQPINPKQIIEEKIRDLSVKIKEQNAQVLVSYDSLPSIITAEPNQIGIVFYNLINNGIKFNQSPQPTVHVNCAKRGNDYLFSVKDNGIGIDPKNHEKIFEIFKRLHRKEEFKGTGIGLASVRRIVEKHGGEVWLESDKNDGTTFYFTLPVK